MKFFQRRFFLVVFLLTCVFSSRGAVGAELTNDPHQSLLPNAFIGSKAGDQRQAAGMPLCWCPPGKFIMGSPRNEPERRPDEAQVEVTLTRGFWMAKFETTQGD